MLYDAYIQGQESAFEKLGLAGFFSGSALNAAEKAVKPPTFTRSLDNIKNLQPKQRNVNLSARRGVPTTLPQSQVPG